MDVSDYCINIPMSGAVTTRWADGQREATTTGTAAVYTPGTPAAISWPDDCGQLCIKVSQQKMQRELEALLNRPARKAVTFARRMNLTTTTSRNWFELVRILDREAGRSDGLLSHRLAIENLQHLLIQGLLLTQAHNYTEALAEDERALSGEVVKRAIDLIHAYPEKHWSTAELARATGVSARAIQKAFHRADEPPPMTYLRRLRLHRVRADLAGGIPGSVTVTAVASSWGFLHLGRFAAQYRELFGESPSDTLRAGFSQSPPSPR